MHLTEVGGALRQRSETDSRLALIFPKGQVAKARRPRLSEFLGKDDLKPIFRVQESKLRQSEKACATFTLPPETPCEPLHCDVDTQRASAVDVDAASPVQASQSSPVWALQVVTLRTDVLLRSLGPLAGLLQKALLPVAAPPLGPPPPPPEPTLKALPAPSLPVPVKGPMMKARASVDPCSGMLQPQAVVLPVCKPRVTRCMMTCICRGLYLNVCLTLRRFFCRWGNERCAGHHVSHGAE